MSNTEVPRCKACQKTPVSDDDDQEEAKFLVCSRCQTMTRGLRKTYYCSKSCQILDWPLHKPTICGKSLIEPTMTPSTTTTTRELETIDTKDLSPSLLFHLATLKTLSNKLPTSTSTTTDSFNRSEKEKELNKTAAYLFFPISPLSPSTSTSTSTQDDDQSSLTLPIPIHLTIPSHKLFTVLFQNAIQTKNRLSITLMYSLLITSVEALKGGEKRLIEQLQEEFGFGDGDETDGINVREEIEKDLEPSQEELKRAIGGEDNLGLLLEWQVEEAERLRNQVE